MNHNEVKTVLPPGMDEANQLRRLIHAVYERDPKNPWGGWESAYHIRETYDEVGDCDAVDEILERAIESEGKTLAQDEWRLSQALPVGGWCFGEFGLMGRKTEGWNITDYRSDKTTVPLNHLLNQFGVFLDPDWDDFREVYELETAKCQEEVIARHPMGDGCWAYIHEGDGLKNLSLQDKYYSLKEWLATDWETDAWGGVPELLAAWRFDAEPYLEKAEEGYEGPCRIWVVRYYFVGNIGAPVDGYLTDESGEQMVFDSFDEAQEWIDEQESGTYLLHSGEVSPPEYIICKAWVSRKVGEAMQGIRKSTAESSWAVTLTMENGTKFDWTGEADDQGHAEGQAIAEAVAKTGEQVLELVGVTKR